jgi:hypothetical protein
MVLRKIFGPKKEEVTGDWRKLHNEELIWLIISRRMRWAGHVARTGLKRNACGYFGGNLNKTATGWNVKV